MLVRWAYCGGYAHQLILKKDGDIMILKIVLNDGREFAVYVYENNENGEIEIMGTLKVDNVEESGDDVFGTNERMLTLYLD